MPLVLSTVISFFIGLAAASAARAWLHTPVRVIGDWAILRHAENPGIAFGVRLPSPWQDVLILSALALVAWIAVRSRTTLSRIAYGLILGGALANVWDRFGDGVVTDYVAIGTFPVFNMPDSCISVGVALLLVENIIMVRRIQKTA